MFNAVILVLEFGDERCDRPAAYSRRHPRRTAEPGALDRGRHPLYLAARPLPHPVPDRPQDLVLDDGGGATALHAGHRLRQRHFRRPRGDRRVHVRQLRLAHRGHPLPQRLPVEPVDRAGLDGVHAAHRLSHRLRHGACAEALAADAADAGHPAVLDLVPDPRLFVDRHPQEGGPAQPVPALDSGSSTSR